MPEVKRDNLGSREDTMRFIDLVGLFGSQAMMALGKVMNPATNKAEKNLAAARLFIDMLDMLERKTQNNLTPDEAKILRATLTDLRLMYAEESRQGSEKTEEDAGEEAPVENAEPAATATAEKPPAEPAASTAPDDSKVKYHKSYGEQ